MLFEDDNNDQEAISHLRDDKDGIHKAILGNQEENVNQIMTKIEEIQQNIKNRNLYKKRAWDRCKNTKSLIFNLIDFLIISTS